MDRIPILENGHEVSFLAVRYDAPEGGGTDRPCFLYIHGFGSDQSGEKAEFFRRQALAAGFAFCSFDFQGHGLSGGALGEITLTRNLEDIARVHDFLRGQGHRRLLLLGSSMGGGSALWYSALHPEEIVAGLHIAPALEMDRGLLTWAGPERTRLWEETGSIHFKNDLVSCDLRWSLIEDMRAFPVETLYVRYRTPCLLLQGKKDTSVPWKSVVDFTAQATSPEIDLHLFADGDHRLTDRKERLWELMMEFLRGRKLI
ncbi:MAG TPA: alpha/beta fold hydrolase [Thermoanaerobaculia bacterium]|nr:alpha/beta fold hydrolase [Thermoanaerobaculia bacterium]